MSRCRTFDRKLHSDVHVTQMPVATFDSLLTGRRRLAGHRALFIHLEAAFLVHKHAAVDRQRRKTEAAPAAGP